ncbi:hypothetical protein [Maribacter halichondriae]|uniref:hypothetical protein n=1 Tax=Maribacter halichondriae TaxID=2980554 RepID=UPI0023588278|nr:hypothetical protein [Maribacter sp. Hal144]
MAETTNGWDAKGLADEDLPDVVDVRIIHIESNNVISGKSTETDVLTELKKNGVNINDYYAVMDYFGLEY